MSLRISSAATLLLVAACSRAPDPVADAAPEDRIECAVGGRAFANACVIERGARLLTLRHSDGSFRRIAVASDGTLSAADGADAVEGEALDDGRFELTVGADRYRLPPRR